MWFLFSRGRDYAAAKAETRRRRCHTMRRAFLGGGRIACITLDVNGTLLGFERNVGEMYAAAAKRCGLTVPDASRLYESFKQSYARTNDDHPYIGGLSMSTKEWWKKVVYGAFDGVGTSYGSEDKERIFEMLYKDYGSSKNFKLFEDTVPFLRDAKADGLKLGVISNQSERFSDEIFPQFGLNSYFDFMVFGKHVLAAKPNREIFQVAINAAELKPTEMLHIGDEKDKDYDGALSAGMHAVLVNRSTGGLAEDVNVGRLPIFKDLVEAYTYIKTL
eukprot:Plantae.Rhodophyta-Purpureofilum_apyrenoidigerum.ctg5882.p1 GENE.Plantae.Rhodophyta-Purpureofilum_apyrenoidigerum.ctg5882~~Plantae.Rhodophyta-Purpureofilum_apyrenoidigerum.ctg5882.p1  ORF type:complete len:275 (+),score=66.29 Plantae.Rhodophyta-Purpureofilum_apyrenoidigerum.ctg5882:28-852(+)